MRAFFEKHKIISSILVTAIQFLGVFLILSFVFHSDDYHAELSISGDYFGAYAYQYPFINALYTRFLILFYRAIGSVPWYSIFDLIFLFASFTAIHYSFLTVLLSKKRSLPFIEGLYSLVFCILLLPDLSAITFTHVAGILSVAAISLLFTKFANVKNQIAHRIVSVVFLSLSFFVRAESCYVGLCFYLLTLFVVDQITKNGALNGFKGMLKGLLPSLSVLLVVVISLSGLALTNYLLRNNHDSQIVLKWNYGRSQLYDYYDQNRYEEDKQFFESINYDENLFNLTKSLWFIDDECNEENLSMIAEYMDSYIPNNGIKQIASNFINCVVENISNRKMVPLLLGSFILFAVNISLAIYKMKARQFWWLLYICAVIFITFCMCLYLCYVGRFKYHVFRLCVFPAFSCLMFSVICMFSNIKSENSKESRFVQNIAGVTAILCPILVLFVLRFKYESNIIYYLIIVVITLTILGCVLYGSVWKTKKYLNSAFSGVLIIAFCLCSCMSVRTICYNAAFYDELQPATNTINNYLNKNPDSVYIVAFPAQTDIKNFITDSDSLINCFYSFDYMQFSAVYQQKMEVNQKKFVTLHSLIEDEVYLINNSENLLKQIEGHLSYITKKSVVAVVIESLENGVNVYSFSVE